MSSIREFYDFMVLRESVRQRRADGRPPPWTDDEVLRVWKFTNVKREHDRTTIGLKAIYDRCLGDPTVTRPIHRSPVALLNCAVYRLFGTVEMARAIGWLETWNEAQADRICELSAERMEADQVVFTSAYVVPNCGERKPKHEVVTRMVTDIWALYHDRAQDTWQTRSWQSFIEDMRAVRGVGAFVGKEIVLDYVLATGWRPDDWDTWTPMGLGAVRGASRVQHEGVVKAMTERVALDVCRRIYAQRETWWPKSYPSLDLTDIQFQLCEFDKYLRVKLDGGTAKNKFVPTPSSK